MVYPIHFFLLVSFSSFGKKNVPIFSPCITLFNTLSARPFAITAASPAFVTTDAASSLVCIPPTPISVFVLNARFFISSETFSTIGITVALLLAVGHLSYNPSTEERIISSSAFSRFVTNAESASLSPNAISSTEIVSFSFTTGIAFN